MEKMLLGALIALGSFAVSYPLIYLLGDWIRDKYVQRHGEWYERNRKPFRKIATVVTERSTLCTKTTMEQG